MRILIVIMSLMLMSCGYDESCEDVDTSQAPDKVIEGPAGVTYYWGGCAIHYPDR